MPDPGTNPGFLRREDAPNETPARRDAAPARPETGRGERPPRSLRRFLRETRGAVGYTAAVIAMMVFGATALVGDHLWMIGKRDLLQSAADAAAVAATFELRRRPHWESDAAVEAALKPLAERYVHFNVLGNTPAGDLEPEDIEVTLDVDRAAGTVAVSVHADIIDTLFAKRLYDWDGPGEITTGAGAERETTRTEVVLAMDVTTSMLQGLAGARRAGEESRMEIVRHAAHELVDILDPGGDEESLIAVGIVPWHINVRLNETMRTAWERDGWALYPSRKTYPMPYWASHPPPPAETWTMQPQPEGWQGCLDQRAMEGRRSPGLTAAHPSDASFTMAFFPVMRGTSYECRDLSADRFPNRFTQRCYHGPTFEEGSIPCPAANGCSQTRLTPQYLCSDAPRRFAPILPLSRDLDEVRDAIDGLEPAGTQTYSTMGLIWGRRLLSPEWREVWGGEVHPVDPNDDRYLGVRKAIVLLTDGEDNYDDEVGAAPDRSAACTAAKAAGIEVFVVAALDPDGIGTALSRGLTDCSSQADHPDRTYVFLNNHSREDLEDAFRRIALQLLTVRRTH